MMEVIVRCLFLTVILFCSSALLAADGQWRWVKAENDTLNGWRTLGGYAEVVVDGEIFRARLIATGSDQTVEISLKGKIKDGKISAKETIEGSDYTGSIYHGSIEKKKWENTGGTVGGESITLTDGWSMIGITRAIPQ
jgi:uncharacterized protein YfaP (DUF2135 family)